DESKQALALFRIKRVRHESPEHGRNKEAEDTSKYPERRLHDAAGVELRREIQNRYECNQQRSKCTIDNRNESTHGKPRHQSGIDWVEQQCRDERSGKEPREPADTCGHANLVAD